MTTVAIQGHTKWSPECTAMRKLLGINELLVMVFENLSTRDLARLQRVCSIWRDLIDGSHPLKLIMHLRAEPSISLVQRWTNNDSYRWKIRAESSIPQNAAFIGRLHPIFERLNYDYNAEYSNGHPLLMKLNTDRLFSWASGSWHQAYLTQPPVRSIQLFYTSRELRRSYNLMEKEPVVDHEGLTFDILLKRVRAILLHGTECAVIVAFDRSVTDGTDRLMEVRSKLQPSGKQLLQLMIACTPSVSWAS